MARKVLVQYLLTNITCKFGALDIDEYPLDHKQLVNKLDELKVRVSCAVVKVEVHIYSFSLQNGWRQTSETKRRDVAALGHGRCEIFPKQEQVLVERGDVGNFINLPYFDAHKTLVAYWKEGPVYVEATLQEFVARIQKIKCDPNKFMELSVGGKPNLFPVLFRVFVLCYLSVLKVVETKSLFSWVFFYRSLHLMIGSRSWNS